jgi:hypothetical protein
MVFFTRLTPQLSGRSFYDLYTVNIQNGLVTRLTYNKRIQFVRTARDSSAGVMVSNDSRKSSLYRFACQKNRITDIRPLDLSGDFVYIGQPDILPDGSRICFAAKRKNTRWGIFIYDLASGVLEEPVPGLEGSVPAFDGPGRILFTARSENFQHLFALDTGSRQIEKVIESDTLILSAKKSGEGIYAVIYTVSGESVVFTRDLEPSSYDFKFEEITRIVPADQTGDLSIRPYNPFRSLYPGYWGIMPVSLNAVADLSGTGVFQIPLFGPAAYIAKTGDNGYFDYFISVALDYMRWYPVNQAGFSWNFPSFSIWYQWDNWAGGQSDLRVISQPGGLAAVRVEEKYQNRYPVLFSNTLGFNWPVPFTPDSGIIITGSFTHRFNEYDSELMRMVNTLQWFEKIQFHVSQSSPSLSRFNRGLILSVSAVEMLDPQSAGSLQTLIRGSLYGALPAVNTIFYGKAAGGISVQGNNSFFAFSNVFSVQNSIFGNGGKENISTVDIKILPYEMGWLASGNAFAELELGTDVTLYRHSRYWRFATLGFKEIYLNIFNELLLMRVQLPGMTDGLTFLADAVFELNLDLFLAYGNILMSTKLGGAIGYIRGLDRPAWSVFGSISFSL